MSLEADLARWREHLTRFAALLGNPPDRETARAPEACSSHCLIFAPHPDDECIVAALPLRLQQEAGWPRSAMISRGNPGVLVLNGYIDVLRHRRPRPLVGVCQLNQAPCRTAILRFM